MAHTQNNCSSLSGYGKSLAIVVPYRDRAEHLGLFISHILAYFERDKLDYQIPISIHVVEQSGNAPFNSGRLKNCGYMLARDQADYFCFHDVDYLPIWADYSWSPKPARLVWQGLTLREDWELFFGAAVLFDKAAFARVNGYPNVYWGWGPEDRELGIRCVLAELGFDRRDGTYRSLPHKHAGMSSPEVATEEARRNIALFEMRHERLRALMDEDGLRNLDFKTIQRQTIKQNGVELTNAVHYLVDIGEPESPLVR